MSVAWRPIHATDWQSHSTVAVGHRLWRRVARWRVWARRADPLVTGALAGGHSQDTGKRRVAAGSGCEFSSLWAAGQRGAAARSSEQMCMSGRHGRGRGWLEVAGGSWMGGGWAGGKVGHSRVIRVSSSNKDSALLCGHTAAYGNALVHSCW